MENIERRIDSEKMPLEAQQLWKDLLEDPTTDLKNLFFDNYVKNCNVIGATCSSIGQKNIIMTESIKAGGIALYRQNSIAYIGRFSVERKRCIILR